VSTSYESTYFANIRSALNGYVASSDITSFCLEWQNAAELSKKVLISHNVNQVIALVHSSYGENERQCDIRASSSKQKILEQRQQFE
jgi:hypothetical protein